MREEFKERDYVKETYEVLRMGRPQGGNPGYSEQMRIALALERIAASLDVFAQKERSERLKGLPDARLALAYGRRQLAESTPTSYEYRHVHEQAIADLLAVWPELADEEEQRGRNDT